MLTEKMREMKELLNKLILNHSLSDEEVLVLSQKLDSLIYQYQVAKEQGQST